MMKVKIFVTAVVWLLLGFLSAQAQVRTCSCVDKEDLLNLLHEAEMGTQELEFQYQLIDKQEAAGKAVMANLERIKVLDENMSNAIKAVTYKSYLRDAVNAVSCSLQRTNGSTDCVRQVLKPLSDHIQKKCLESKSSLGPDQPYYEAMEMKSFLVSFMRAYDEMRKSILQMLKELPKNCRPNNWFGYVVYQKVRTFGSVKTIPPTLHPSGRGSQGGTETLGTKDTYIGTIFVEEGKAASAKGYAAYSLDEGGTSSLRDMCSKKTGVETVTTSYGRKDFAEGAGGGNAEFSLNVYPAKGTYNISMKFFSVLINGTINSFSKTTATACKAGSYNNSVPLNRRFDAPDHYMVEAKIDRKMPDYLWGSKIEKPPYGNLNTKDKNISTVTTTEIQVRWTLRRLPAK